MTPQDLLARIQSLPADTPRHKALETALRVRVGYWRAWYRSQKEHWQGWLGEYDGPGAYGRGAATPRNAEYIWNHIQCAPMLFWLAEALGLPDADLERAYCAVMSAQDRGAAQCAALRRVFPWAVIESALPAPKCGLMSKGRAFMQGVFGE